MEYRYDLFDWQRERTEQSYDAIAKKCGLSKNTVWLIICGETNPTASSINAICRALGLQSKFALDPTLQPEQFRRALVKAR